MGLDIYYIFRIAFIWIVLMKFMILYERCLCAQVNREVIHISLELQDFEAHLLSSFINRLEYSTAKPSQRHLQIHCIHNLPAVWSARAEPPAPLGRRSDGVDGGSSIDVPWRYSPMQEAEIFECCRFARDSLNMFEPNAFCQVLSMYLHYKEVIILYGTGANKREGGWIFRVVWNAFLPVSQCARAPVSHERCPFLRGRL